MYLELEAAMSLSRFYKKNQDFQPENILPQGNISGTQPVWGESIIKETIEAINVEEPNVKETATKEEPVAENPPEVPVEQIEEVYTPPQVPAAPEIDRSEKN